MPRTPASDLAGDQAATDGSLGNASGHQGHTAAHLPQVVLSEELGGQRIRLLGRRG